MKRISVFTVILLTLASLGFSQCSISSDKTIRSYTIEITYNKTSTIVFPASIISVDRGSGEIIAQKVKQTQNVLQLKANRNGFSETNLSVITADGILRHFTVKYLLNPSVLTIDLSNEESNKKRILFDSDLTDADLERCIDSISIDKRRIHLTNARTSQLKFSLLGLYIKADVMFYRFEISNRSNIDYDVDFLKLYIRDRSKVKRAASQEVELVPISLSGNIQRISGNTTEEIIVAVGKQTIPNSKFMNIELFEKNGGRHLTLEIKSKAITNARLLR